MRGYRYVLLIFLLVGIAGVVFCQIKIYDRAVPSSIQLLSGEESSFDLHVPASATISDSQCMDSGKGSSLKKSNDFKKNSEKKLNLSKAFTLKSSSDQSFFLNVKLWGILPLKTTKVTTISEKKVIAGGKNIGIYVETDGVLILGTSAVTECSGMVKNPSEHIVAAGDYITAVNGKKIHYKSEFLDYLKKNKTKPVVLMIRRGSRYVKVRITPVETKKEQEYKCGIWIRDDTQGIGTITYVTEDGKFGALGHGVSDIDTGKLLEAFDGKIYKANLSYVIPGGSGTPGELVGSIDYSSKNLLGTIEKNTESGIFGTGNKALFGFMEQKSIPVALKQEVKEGPAYIQSYVNGKCEQYEIMIEKCYMGSENAKKGMMIRVKDPRLLKLTGGIVQGMSGSPIIQNGKLVGAVTHVFVNDPARGYGIFAENMMQQ